jgi:hypothetical protein
VIGLNAILHATRISGIAKLHDEAKEDALLVLKVVLHENGLRRRNGSLVVPPARRS